jgi:hypothetical protein
MDSNKDNSSKQSQNIINRLLRKNLNQKDETLKVLKNENIELKVLILKQQKLMDKLYNENIKLSKSSNKIMSNSKQQSELLIECNSSLKQQLLISQNQNSVLLHDLQKSFCEIKHLNKQLSMYK